MSEIELLPAIVEQARQHVASFEAVGGTVAYPFSVRLARYVVLQHEELERLRRSPPQVGRGMALMSSADLGCYDDEWTLDLHYMHWVLEALVDRTALSSPPAEEGGSAAGAPPFASKRSARSALSAELQDVLGEIEAFLQDQHDIRDGEGGQQLPNKAMALSIALKEALGERP